MKNLLLVLVFAIALVFSSCGADQKVVDACADDMCKAVESLDIENDPMSIISFAEEMAKIMEKEGYDGVTQSQLYSAMEKKCPDGYKKFKKMMDEANK